jgi:V8-like Glu-specific endopeptidase
MDIIVQRSIPKVECGKQKGTAFLVSPNIALTATHAVADFLNEGKEVKLTFRDISGVESIIVYATPLVNGDDHEYPIIALQLAREINEIPSLECIDYKFNTAVECFSFGYPPARSNEGTFIDLTVVNYHENIFYGGWNLDLKINDGIKDFQGVSGAPVIFDNRVVGVIQRQVSEDGEASRLSGVSLHLFTEYLISAGVHLKSRLHSGIYNRYLQGIKKELEIKLNNSLVRMLTRNRDNLGFPIKIKDAYDADKSEQSSTNTFAHLLDLKEPSIVLAEPGGGKTHLLNMLAKEVLDNPLYGEEKVPVILSARYWGRSYSTLYQGIYNEVKPYNPEISLEQIETDFYSGKFLLLVDALDEVTVSMDLLVEELLQKSKITGAEIIVSCRAERYHKQLFPSFREFKLLQLDEKQIVEYVSEELGDYASNFLHSLGENLKKLVTNPLFLYMTVYIVKQSANKALPKNKSELYSVYSEYLIMKRYLEKGIAQRLRIDEIKKVRILANYANTTFRKTGDRYILNECIESVLSGELVDVAKQELLDTGLLVQNGDHLEFYHPSFQEYFLAVYLSQLEESKITSLITSLCHSEVYYEVFQYLSGLLRISERQVLLFDVLERENILLYRKCLETRYNFSQIHFSNWTRDYTERYFNQVRESYLSIINNAMPHIRRYIMPWNQLDESGDLDNFDIVIYGSMDPTRPAIRYSFKLINKESKFPRVHVQEFGGGVSISTQGNDGKTISTPIISFSMGNEMYFDLRLSYLGIDSAREVALSAVKQQLKELIEKQLIIDFEPLVLKFEYIEKVLKKLNTPIFKIEGNDGFSRPSLYKHSLEKIIKVLASPEGIKYGEGLRNYGYLTGRDYFQTLVLLFDIHNQGIEQYNYLSPAPDISWDTINKQSCYSWELWSDEQFCKLLSFVYNQFQGSYRHMVETLFISLKDYLPYYSVTPIKYSVTVYKSENISQGASVESIWLPVPSGVSTDTEVKVVSEKERGDYRDLSIDIAKRLQQLNRKHDHYSYGQSSWISLYVSEDEVIRKKVYHQLKDDFQYIFGKF